MKSSNLIGRRSRIPPNICQEILPNLFLGGQAASEYAATLEVDFIVSIGARSKANNIETVHYGTKDEKSADIQAELNEIVAIIQDKLNRNCRILVHCKAGINRSPSFVLAFICVHLQIPIDHGIDFILSKRSICRFSLKDQVSQWLENKHRNIKVEEISG
jgi:protein-tyrosine phosphatase